ncbi:MAG: serine/threonine-protein kinase [Myxococcota bacterium]
MGRYRTLRPLRSGGMAEVFEAVALGEEGFERKVVLKRLLPELAEDAEAKKSFIDEARILSRIHHPGIVAVLDFGTEDGAPFQVLERVDGLDLEMLLGMLGGPVPAEIALGMVAEVAEALAYAHALSEGGRPLGLIHRDVTPDNILLAWTGELKLADFGIARAHQRLARTQVGVTKGKLEYMAPEQALGGEVDARADLYSLGLVLHRLATGRSPLEDAAARKLHWAGGSLAIDSALAEDLRALVERATQHRPAERFPDAQRLADAALAALDARGAKDPRRARRRWLEPLIPRPAEAPKPRRALSALLGGDALLDLVPPEEAGEGGPEEPITRATEIRADEPTDPGPVPTEVLERTPISPAVTAARSPEPPPAPKASSGPGWDRQWLALGLVLAFASAILGGVAWRALQGEPLPLPSPAAEVRPTARSSTLSAAPAIEEARPAPSAEPSPSPSPRRAPKPSQKRGPTRPELERAYLGLLTESGLREDEAKTLEGARAAMISFRAALAEDPAAAEAELKKLAAILSGAELPASLLEGRVQALRALLSARKAKLSEAELVDYDGRILALQSKVRQRAAGSDARALLRTLSALEVELKAR